MFALFVSARFELDEFDVRPCVANTFDRYLQSLRQPNVLVFDAVDLIFHVVVQRRFHFHVFLHEFRRLDEIILLRDLQLIFRLDILRDPLAHRIKAAPVRVTSLDKHSSSYFLRSSL